MLVGPWKGSSGGVRTFMTNVASSFLNSSFEVLRFNTSRPPKRNATNNYGYGAIFHGGIRRLLSGVVITMLHVASFPFVLVIKRPAVVQVQSSDFLVFWEASLYVWIARALRYPVLMRLGGAFDYFYAVSSPHARAMIRRVLEWPDRLIVQSDYWEKTARALGRTEGIVVLPNSVPDALVATIRGEKAAPPLCFFAAGSEAVRKGIDDILEAMRLLHHEKVRVRLHVVAASDELKQCLIDADLVDLVTADSFLAHADTLEAMGGAQIFLLPSRAEGFPNALVEAMALGLAPIVTTVGAIPEIVEGTGAIVVPVKDARALADAIATLANDAGLRAQIGAAAREAVKMRYVHSRVMPILGQAWQALLPEGANGRGG